MKKNNKSRVLISGALMALSGLVICTVCGGMAADYNRIINWPEVRFGNFIAFSLPENRSFTVQEQESSDQQAVKTHPIDKDFEGIKNIELINDMCDVSIVSGNRLSVESSGTGEIDFEENGNTLIINGPAGSFLDSSSMTITVPSDIGHIKIEQSSGNLDIKNLKVQALSIYNELGSVHIEKAGVKILNLESEAGAIEAENCSFDQGSISVDLGSLKLSGRCRSSLDAHCEAGKIDITLFQDQSSANLDLSSEMGSINLNGQDIKGNVRIENNGMVSIHGSVEIGQIILNFSQNNETAEQ